MNPGDTRTLPDGTVLTLGADGYWRGPDGSINITIAKYNPNATGGDVVTSGQQSINLLTGAASLDPNAQIATLDGPVPMSTYVRTLGGTVGGSGGLFGSLTFPSFSIPGLGSGWLWILAGVAVLLVIERR